MHETRPQPTFLMFQKKDKSISFFVNGELIKTEERPDFNFKSKEWRIAFPVFITSDGKTIDDLTVERNEYGFEMTNGIQWRGATFSGIAVSSDFSLHNAMYF